LHALLLLQIIPVTQPTADWQVVVALSSSLPIVLLLDYQAYYEESSLFSGVTAPLVMDAVLLDSISALTFCCISNSVMCCAPEAAARCGALALLVETTSAPTPS
jgi:hypothetical protein